MALTEIMYPTEKLLKMRETLMQDFREKHMSLVDYARHIGLPLTAVDRFFRGCKKQRLLTYNEINDYLKSLEDGTK